MAAIPLWQIRSGHASLHAIAPILLGAGRVRKDYRRPNYHFAQLFDQFRVVCQMLGQIRSEALLIRQH